MTFRVIVRYPDWTRFGGTSHHLLVFGPVAEVESLRQFARRWSNRVEITRDPDVDPARAGIPTGGTVLIRPDGHIGFRSQSVDAAAVAAVDRQLSSYFDQSRCWLTKSASLCERSRHRLAVVGLSVPGRSRYPLRVGCESIRTPNEARASKSDRSSSALAAAHFQGLVHERTDAVLFRAPTLRYYTAHTDAGKCSWLEPNSRSTTSASSCR